MLAMEESMYRLREGIDNQKIAKTLHNLSITAKVKD
jgi:hypothetical protein